MASKPLDVARLEAEIDGIVSRLEELSIELAQETDLLKRTIEVNRKDTLGMAMRAACIHGRAVRLLAMCQSARAIDDLRYPLT